MSRVGSNVPSTKIPPPPFDELPPSPFDRTPLSPCTTNSLPTKLDETPSPLLRSRSSCSPSPKQPPSPLAFSTKPRHSRNPKCVDDPPPPLLKTKPLFYTPPSQSPRTLLLLALPSLLSALGGENLKPNTKTQKKTEPIKLKPQKQTENEKKMQNPPKPHKLQNSKPRPKSQSQIPLYHTN